jgi:hypothetical protein
MTDLPVIGRRDRRTQGLDTRRKLGVSRAGLGGAAFAVAVGVFGLVLSPSPGLVFASALVLALLFLLLWQENEPPLLLLPALFQWLSVATKPLMTIFLHVPVNALSEFDTDIVPGITLGLAAVTALAIGMRLALGRPVRDWNAVLRNEALRINTGSMLKVTISAILLGHLMFFMMRFAGPASQLIYALANIRFVGLFALAYWCFTNSRGFFYLAIVMTVEILIGITGFFSDFKAPIFVIVFAALAAGHRPKFRDTVLVGIFAVVLIVFGSFWSNVKLDYRNYISGGTMSQVITVPLRDRIDYMWQEVKTFDGARFADGFDKLLRRQSYIDFLSSTMEYVPQVLPHEHGARIGRSLIHILTPRILFPNKPPTEFDSEVTAHYTGLPLQMREGTSISIGYLGELYIDFGKVGAVIACLVLGLAFGWAYRLVSRHQHGSLQLTYGARSTALVVLMPFDTALIKYVGGVAVAFIAAFLLQKFLVPVLSRQLRLRRSEVPRGPPGQPV